MERKQPSAQVLDLAALQAYAPEQLVNVPLWDGEAFYGRLLCLEPGQEVPSHTHQHKDECFDVLQGRGTFWVNGQALEAGPNTHVYVPAGVVHGFKADQDTRWVLRETVSERVYARRAWRLLGRAALKRLPMIGVRWQ